MTNDPLLDNALCFLTGKIIPYWHVLAAMDGHSEQKRQLILAVPAAIAFLPHFDEDLILSAEIDYKWDDKHWLGRLFYKDCELELWSCISQIEGPARELATQWMNTATKISGANGLVKHDPGHLWLWGEYFAHFAKSCRLPMEGCVGHVILKGHGREIYIHTASSCFDEELDKCEENECE
jgi:hypothetical protein